MMSASITRDLFGGSEVSESAVMIRINTSKAKSSKFWLFVRKLQAGVDSVPLRFHHQPPVLARVDHDEASDDVAPGRPCK